MFSLLTSIFLFGGSFDTEEIAEKTVQAQQKSLNHIDKYHKQEVESNKRAFKKTLNETIDNYNNPNKTITGDWKLNQDGTATGNKYSNSESKGKSSFLNSFEVCFEFNNIGELDNDSSLHLYKDKNKATQTKESRTYLSNNLIKACSKGSEMGGKWNFRYSTKNDTRTGSITISGDCHKCKVDLNKGDWYNDNSIKIIESNCD
jgi:hypothetical protein